MGRHRRHGKKRWPPHKRRGVLGPLCRLIGDRVLRDKPLFDEYYRREFQEVASVCGLNPKARETVDTLKGAGYRLALATNPLFPAVATESRIRWAGLEPGDFELYTTYENTGYCKPNPAYYRDLLERLGCDAEDCLMVGNDVEEDMVAGTVGIKVFLLTDCIINKQGRTSPPSPMAALTSCSSIFLARGSKSN